MAPALPLSEQRGMRRKGCHLSQTPEKGETDLSLSNEKMPKPLLMRIGAFFSPLFLKKNRAPFRSLGLWGERKIISRAGEKRERGRRRREGQFLPFLLLLFLRPGVYSTTGTDCSVRVHLKATPQFPTLLLSEKSHHHASSRSNHLPLSLSFLLPLRKLKQR